MNCVSIKTLDGTFTAYFSSAGLARLDFPSAEAATPLRPTAADSALRPWLELTRRALLDALRGVSPAALPPLDLSAGSEFQRSVWRTLTQIPVGRTWTYTEVARGINRPQAARAVGQACGANPIPVLIPCHRVLAANRKIGGFSGGLDWKRKLLNREQESD
jgi:methylated-DNA-[protein]-cysteine S-methyltransferase